MKPLRKPSPRPFKALTDNILMWAFSLQWGARAIWKGIWETAWVEQEERKEKKTIHFLISPSKYILGKIRKRFSGIAATHSLLQQFWDSYRQPWQWNTYPVNNISILLNRRPLEKIKQESNSWMWINCFQRTQCKGKGRRGSMATASFCAASPKIRQPFCQCCKQVNRIYEKISIKSTKIN